MQQMILSMMAALAMGCGGKSLDLGGSQAGSEDGASPAAPWPVALQHNARALQSDGAYLYWIADRGERSEIRRCEKARCASTVVSLTQASIGASWSTLGIRSDTIYIGSPTTIASCPLTGCPQAKAIVDGLDVKAVAFDDVSAYWAVARDGIYVCPLAGCSAGRRLVSANAVEIAVDATRVYWTEGDGAIGVPVQNSIAVRSAPKDGVAPPGFIVAEQNQAKSISISDGFAYWGTSFSLGAIVRCPVETCANDELDVLASRQYFPMFATSSGDSVYWMNGATAPGNERPVQIWGCQSGNCASTLRQLDEGTGGGYGARAAEMYSGPLSRHPASEMVVDADAIYWVGDVVNLGSYTTGLSVDASLKRTARPN